MQANSARTWPERLKPFLKLRPRHFLPELPRIEEARTGLSMGEHCERMAQTWQIGRAEQDELALLSHQRLLASFDEGWHEDLLTPYLGLARDNNLRADLTLEQLAKLKPAFDRSGQGTLTAGNSTPLTDGASLVLLGTEEWAREHDLPVLAYVVDGETAAVDFVTGHEGLLMAPVYAVPRLLARNGLTLQDFDYYGFTRPSPPRCCARSRPGRMRSTAARAWALRSRWAPSIAASSMSKAAPGDRASVRGYRRAHPGEHGQVAGHGR